MILVKSTGIRQESKFSDWFRLMWQESKTDFFECKQPASYKGINFHHRQAEGKHLSTQWRPPSTPLCHTIVMFRGFQGVAFNYGSTGPTLFFYAMNFFKRNFNNILFLGYPNWLQSNSPRDNLPADNSTKNWFFFKY